MVNLRSSGFFRELTARGRACLCAVGIGGGLMFAGCSDGGANDAPGEVAADDALPRTVADRDPEGVSTVTPPPSQAPEAGVPVPSPPDTAVVPPCDQTLSVGANLPAAVMSATSGTTLCLNAGNYGSITISGAKKTSDVVIRSATDTTAKLSVSIESSSHVRFQKLTLYGMEISGATNVTAVSNVFVGDGQSGHATWRGTGQVVYHSAGNGGAGNLISRNSFSGISVCANCYEGWISAQPGGVASGLAIRDNTFTGPGDGDFIQTGTRGVVIGPGNSFVGLSQRFCDAHSGRHCDAIQGYGQDQTTIDGNYFRDNDSGIMMPDGGNREVITNNVLVGKGDYGQVQLGSHVDTRFEHNTVVNMAVGMNAKSGGSPSRNGIVRSNLWLSNARIAFDCTGCVSSHQMIDAATQSTCAAHGAECTFGQNLLVGVPTFTGGASATKSWSGWRLASGSLGAQSGYDGKDRGATTFDPSP